MIYGLRKSPRSKKIFYVGKTSNPKQRLAAHRSIFGKKTELDQLQVVKTKDRATIAEIKWIRKVYECNPNILNVCGIGVVRYSESARRKKQFEKLDKQRKWRERYGSHLVGASIYVFRYASGEISADIDPDHFMDEYLVRKQGGINILD